MLTGMIVSAAQAKFTQEELSYLPAMAEIALFKAEIITPSDILKDQIPQVQKHNGVYNTKLRDLVKELNTLNADKINAICFNRFAEARQAVQAAAERYRNGTTAVNIFFGNNDAVIGRGVWRDEPIVSPQTFEDNLKWIIHLCRLLGGIRKFSITAIAARMEGRRFSDYGDIRREYCLAARRAADAMDACLVPLDAVFTELREKNIHRFSTEGLLYTMDGLHLNAEGNRIAADTMLHTWNLL